MPVDLSKTRHGVSIVMMPQPNLFSEPFVYLIYSQIKGIRWGIVSEQQHIPKAKPLSFFFFSTSWVIPGAVLKHLLESDCFSLPLQTFLIRGITFKECIVAQIFFHSCSFFFVFSPPHFWIRDGGTQAKIFRRHLLEALGENGSLLLSVSTLDAAIVVFYMEKKIVCT